MERDSFVFYKDWAELRSKFPKLADRLINAIIDYGIYGTEPTDEELLLCFELIKGQIDRDRVKYDERAERSRENGRKSKGAPVGNQNARKQPKQPAGLNSTQNNPKQPKQPKQPDNVNVNDNDNVYVNTSSSIDSDVYALKKQDERQETNRNYFQRYFAEEKMGSLEQLLMQLHSANPKTSTIEDFKALAWQVISEWEQNEEPAQKDYTEWSKRLISQIRIKNKIQNESSSAHRQFNDPATAEAKRNAEFASYIAAKLARGEEPNDVQNWY